MNLTGKKVVVVGLARSGEAVAAFCAGRNARVTVADLASEKALGGRVQKVRDLGCAVELGPHKTETFEKADLVVISPGVPHAIPVLEAARAKGIPVIGEVELACRFIREPILAVTGTNGKTTVTSLAGEMLEASGIKTFVGGNIGNPLINYAIHGGGAQVAVAEISSFQLDTIQTFAPHVAILTHVTEDHLDRYADMAAYAASKARVFMNQGPEDFAILNGQDIWTRSMEENIRAQRLYFTFAGKDESGADISPEKIDFRIGKDVRWSLSLAKTSLPGEHNRENIAAAALACFAAGAAPEGIQKALDAFVGLPHRLEFVRELAGVRYYNDSKATNVDAVYRALQGFDCPVHLLMGGRDKGSNFDILRQIAEEKVARLYLTGEAAGIISKALSGTVDTVEAGTIGSAVKLARQAAKAGEAVLLSSGCASFDQYNNYKERGLDFVRAVKAL